MPQPYRFPLPDGSFAYYVQDVETYVDEHDPYGMIISDGSDDIHCDGVSCATCYMDSPQFNEMSCAEILHSLHRFRLTSYIYRRSDVH